jgi:hypothetical protein
MSSRAVFRAGIAATISPLVEPPIFLDGLFALPKTKDPSGGTTGFIRKSKNPLFFGTSLNRTRSILEQIA